MTRRLLVGMMMFAGALAGATPWESSGAQPPPPPDRGGRRGMPPRPNVLEKAFEWSGALAPGQRVVVRNVNGNIRVQPSTGKTLDIVANKFWRRGKPESVKIDATRFNSDRDVLVCVRWPGTTTCTESEYTHSSHGENDANDVMVELVIMLPAGANALLTSVAGDISVTDATGDLWASTASGRIRLGTSGTVHRAETSAGDVRVQMAKLPEREGRYAAVTGSVYVTIPENANANVEARTLHGEIRTDFPIAVTGPFSSRQLRGTIGKGGPRLVLESMMGAVRVLKQ
ncbi:MAG TPA: DUF4097 family beta strand repeat-containing protein [Gemmatimonadaceae bacterium]|nr:DUF4097 family beta strand repeat-containing protein [Gemmatimonadaceae bacterium]